MSETTLVETMVWFHVAMAAGLAALAWWLPKLTRRDLYFAVTVDPAWPHGAEGRRALAAYRRCWLALVLAPAVAAVGCALWLAPATALVAIPGLMIVEVIGLMAGFLAARHRALPASRSHADAAPPAAADLRLPGGWLGQAGPFLLLAAVAVVLVVAWDSIPARYPVHYDASFQPDRWVERTVGGVALPFVFGVLFTLPMWWLQWALVRRARQIEAGGAAAAAESLRRRVNAEIVLVAVYLIAAVCAAVALGPLFQAGAESARAWLTLTVGLSVVGSLAVIAWLVVRLLPLYARRPAESASGGGGPLGDRTADEHWKMGLIYYNPTDPALFIEKRFGIGYTMNMARPVVWLVLAALLVLPLLLLLLAL